MRRSAIVFSLVALLGAGSSVPASAAPPVATVAPSGTVALGAAAGRSFANCAALNRTYPGGVAKSKRSRNTKVVRGRTVVAASSYKPKVSARLYAANIGRDRDKDGIACER